MIQLANDLLITNNNLGKTPKETKKQDGKDFASFLEMENGDAGVDLGHSGRLPAEGEGAEAENADDGKKAANGGDFLNVNLGLNIEPLIDESVSIGQDAVSGETEETAAPDENEENNEGKAEHLALNINSDNAALINVNLQNALMGNIETEDASLAGEKLNIETLNTENLDSEGKADPKNQNTVNLGAPKMDFGTSLQNAEGAAAEADGERGAPVSKEGQQSSPLLKGEGVVELPVEGKKADGDVSGTNPGSAALEEKISPQLTLVNETAGGSEGRASGKTNGESVVLAQEPVREAVTDAPENAGRLITESESGRNTDSNAPVTDEVSAESAGKSGVASRNTKIDAPVVSEAADEDGRVAPPAPDGDGADAADLSSKVVEAGAEKGAAVNLNGKPSARTETKGQKRSDAVTDKNKSEAVGKSELPVSVSDEKGIPAVDETADEALLGEKPKVDNTPAAALDAEKESGVKKTGAPFAENDGFDLTAKDDAADDKLVGEQVKGSHKEAGPERNAAQVRPEFQDFLDRISEQRSASNSNSSGKAQPQPQQMTLANKGAAAFTESVGHIVRFGNIGGITKATLIVDPPSIGRVNIEITSADNGIETVLKVSNEQVRVLVQDQIFQLKQNLAQIGVNLTEFSVDVQQDDGRQRGQSYNSKSRKTRFGVAEEEQSEAEKIETFRVDLRKGLLHWIA